MTHRVKSIQYLVSEYRHSGGPWPATKIQIASWALETGRWKMRPDMALRICADEIANAMGEEYMTDPKGRRVRVKHSAKVKQNGQTLTLWGDIRDMAPTFMQISVTQRRNQIVGECHQLKNDVDSFNDRNPTSQQICLVLDFRQDVAELEGMRDIRAA
ncbi:MAG: hypothetical protein ACREL3_13355 [Gemmatimonadales bacterium]